MSADSAYSIIGIGLDLVDCLRFARLLPAAEHTFKNRVFTAAEWNDCWNRKKRISALAARFAAKEACLKAFGSGWAQGIALNEVSLQENAPGGALGISLTGAADHLARQLGVRHIHVSVNHDHCMAAAIVLLTG